MDMHPEARRSEGPDGRQMRADGGSPMPGVPSEEDSQDTATDAETGETSSETNASSGSPMPGVPESQGPEPAVESGGGGSCETPDHADDGDEETHELTTAFTLAALQKLKNPAGVVSEARSWSDWVGVVGNVDAPTLNTFLRRNTVDIDFFNGAGPPEERLKRIAADASAFHSDRLVLVGTEDQAEMAAVEGWEFQALEDTAAEAGWELQ